METKNVNIINVYLTKAFFIEAEKSCLNKNLCLIFIIIIERFSKRILLNQQDMDKNAYIYETVFFSRYEIFVWFGE